MMGKTCDSGHRWMCSKTVSDCVEGLIGAYFVGGILDVAFSFLKWLGMEVETSPVLVEEAIKTASLWCYLPKLVEIESLESKINYFFSTKGLLLEAMTHSLDQELVAYCYQVLNNEQMFFIPFFSHGLSLVSHYF